MIDWPLYALSGFILGLWLGTWLTNKKWRSNADTYIRIESGGRLYKVSYDD